MKTNEVLGGVDAAKAIKTLLAECRVALLAACKRANLQTSTFYRWEGGAAPKVEGYKRLRLAVLQVANERETLPKKYVEELASLRRSVKPAGKAQDIVGRVASLEQRVEQLEARA